MLHAPKLSQVELALVFGHFSFFSFFGGGTLLLSPLQQT